jgi:hypothetical protein
MAALKIDLLSAARKKSYSWEGCNAVLSCVRGYAVQQRDFANQWLNHRQDRFHRRPAKWMLSTADQPEKRMRLGMLAQHHFAPP